MVASHLPGLSWEDVSDALEYSGLTGVVGNDHHSYPVSETCASFAGTGYGLCKHYNHPHRCEDEEYDMPSFHVLTLSFSRVSFDVESSYMQYAWESLSNRQIFRFDLGFDNLPHDQNDREVYWENIRKTIVDTGKALDMPLGHLLLLGDVVDNPQYIGTVQDALMELLPHESTRASILQFSKIHQPLDPLYIAARGAAEFAKRIQEAPQECKESRHCRKNRHPQDGDTDMKDQTSLNEEL